MRSDIPGKSWGQWICSNYWFFTSICKDLCAFLLQAVVLRISAPDAAHAPGAELGSLPAGLQDISVSPDLAVGLCRPLRLAFITPFIQVACVNYSLSHIADRREHFWRLKTVYNCSVVWLRSFSFRKFESGITKFSEILFVMFWKPLSDVLLNNVILSPFPFLLGVIFYKNK